MTDSVRQYEALTAETLTARLGELDALTSVVGGSKKGWKVAEVGDGNLNLVFIVTGAEGTAVVKQALPYVRLVGDSWPLPRNRAFFETQTLERENTRDPGRVPVIYHFDDDQSLIIMEYLTPHKILRGLLIEGHKVEGLANALGMFCARTAFRGSDLSMSAEAKKAEVALYQGNAALCKITEELVFTDPYYDAKLNHHTNALSPLVTMLRNDVALKTEVQSLLLTFTAAAETLCHGDLHTGSIMCTTNDTKVIDPEFGFYGPLGFDLGMLIANLLMSYFSQPAHRSDSQLDDFQHWILDIVSDTTNCFNQTFTALWNTERTGILFPKALFEDQGDSSDMALNHVLSKIWQDALGFAGIEMHRRVLSLAHNADFESIEDESLRAQLEARNVMLGRLLILQRRDIKNVAALAEYARTYNAKEAL